MLNWINPVVIPLQVELTANSFMNTFMVTKHYLAKEMVRVCKETGVKKLKIHGLRHSHISFLIDRGFTALAIEKRVGYSGEKITYRYAHLFPSKQDEMANKTVAFRVLPKEDAMLEATVRASGLTKQDYII